MTDVKKLGKKLFTVSVVAMTIIWSMGVAALMPAVVLATEECPTLEAGDLWKVADISAVYVLNADLESMYFPNSEIYHTWYEDFSGVQTIAKSCVSLYPTPSSLPVGVNFRFGSMLVKRQIQDDVYAVLPGNKLAHVGSEAIAAALYGSDWNKKVRDVNDAFWPNYTDKSGSVSASQPHDGMLVKVSGADIYSVDNGKLYKVDGAVPAKNKNVQTVSQTVFDTLEVASGTVTGASVVTNPTQSAVTVTPPGDDEDEDGDEEEIPVGGGDLTISLAADTPAAATLADGTAYNNMLKLNLKAGADKDVKVKGITVTRTGLISNTYVTGVSVWDKNGDRHGDVMTSFNSDNKVTIGFSSDPILVAKDTTETLTISFNISASAGSATVGAKVGAKTDIDSDGGSIEGSFPLAGNVMSVADGGTSLADAVVAAQAAGGLSSEPGSSTAGNVEIGESKEIAKVRFTQSNGLNDLAVDKITFYLQGTVKEKDLKDFTLYAPDNSVLGSTEWSSNRYVTVKLTTPYNVPKSTNRTLTLKATANDGSGNWFRVHVQSDYDVLVKDAALGYYLVPSDGAGTWDSQAASDGYFKMKSGALTLSKTSDSPAGNVSAGASSLVLAKFNVKAVGEDMEIRKIGIKIATSAGSTDLSGNVSLKVGNETLLTFSGDYSAALYSTGSQRNLSQYLTVKSGETKVLEVVGNIDTNANADTYTVSIGNFYAKRMSTLDFADNVPTSGYTDSTANQLTVQTTNLSFNKDTSMGNKTVGGAATSIVGQYVVRAGNAEGVRLTNTTVGFAGYGATNVPTQLQNLELWVGDTQLGSTISSVATSSNSFSFDLSLAKNESKVLKVKAYVVSGASGTASTTVESHTYIGASTSNTTSETADVIGQDITFGSASVTISAVSDSSTISKVYTTADTPVQLGKWKVAASNEEVKLKKITFQLRDNNFADDTAAGNFGKLYLYDSANLATALAEADYVPGTSNGYVQFSGFELAVSANSYKFLVLKGKINASGTINSDSINEFVVKDDSNSNLELYSAAGSLLAVGDINGSGANSRFATSTYYKFHDAYPVISKVDVGSLEIGSLTPIFKFIVKNEGTVDLRFVSTTITATVTGLTSNGTTATGTIGGWRLYEANESGGLGTYLAATSTWGIAGGANAPTTLATSFTTANTLDITFGDGIDQNDMLNNFLISPGTSRTFIVTANTNYIGTGKGSTAFTVQVSGSITGSTGWSGSAWNTGNFYYHYTPIGASETSALRHSDSYDVLGSTISRTF